MQPQLRHGAEMPKTARGHRPEPGNVRKRARNRPIDCGKTAYSFVLRIRCGKKVLAASARQRIADVAGRPSDGMGGRSTGRTTQDVRVQGRRANGGIGAWQQSPVEAKCRVRLEKGRGRKRWKQSAGGREGNKITPVGPHPGDKLAGTRSRVMGSPLVAAVSVAPATGLSAAARISNLTAPIPPGDLGAGPGSPGIPRRTQRRQPSGLREAPRRAGHDSRHCTLHAQ